MPPVYLALQSAVAACKGQGPQLLASRSRIPGRVLLGEQKHDQRTKRGDNLARRMARRPKIVLQWLRHRFRVSNRPPLKGQTAPQQIGRRRQEWCDPSEEYASATCSPGEWIAPEEISPTTTPSNIGVNTLATANTRPHRPGRLSRRRREI